MTKKTKEDDWSTGWRCGDCGGWNTKKAKSCVAPYHDIAERAIRAEFLLARLSNTKQENYEMTPKEFSAQLCDMLAEYLDKQYADGKVNQYDLITASMSFFEAAWIMIGSGYQRPSSSLLD